MTSRSCALLAVTVLLAAAIGCSRKPTAADAKTFLDQAEARLLTLSEEAGRAAWVQNTYITDDTEMLAARANQRAIDAVVQLVKESKRFEAMQLPPDLE